MQSFELEDERHWSAKVKIPLGLGSLAMSIDFEKIEERELEFASLHAKGHGVGAHAQHADLVHAQRGRATGTRMLWAADVSIAGPVGSMGQRVLQPIVKQQVNLVLTALDKRVNEAASADDGAVAAPPQQ